MPRGGDVCPGTIAANLSFTSAGVAAQTETTRRCRGAHHVAVCYLPDLPFAMTLPRSDGRTHTAPSCVLSVAHGCMGVLRQQATSASCVQRLPACLPASEKHCRPANSCKALACCCTPLAAAAAARLNVAAPPDCECCAWQPVPTCPHVAEEHTVIQACCTLHTQRAMPNLFGIVKSPSCICKDCLGMQDLLCAQSAKMTGVLATWCPCMPIMPS